MGPKMDKPSKLDKLYYIWINKPEQKLTLLLTGSYKLLWKAETFQLGTSGTQGRERYSWKGSNLLGYIKDAASQGTG